MQTPWGKAEHVTRHAGGFITVQTAGHGGIYVPPAMEKFIPAEEREYAARWSGAAGWYEEDCCAASVLFVWPELWPGSTPEKRKAWHDSTLRYIAEAKAKGG